MVLAAEFVGTAVPAEAARSDVECRFDRTRRSRRHPLRGERSTVRWAGHTDSTPRRHRPHRAGLDRAIPPGNRRDAVPVERRSARRTSGGCPHVSGSTPPRWTAWGCGGVQLRHLCHQPVPGLSRNPARRGCARGSMGRAAVNTTASEVVLYDGRPIEAVYTSMVGSRSRANQDVWASNPVPYLQPVDSPEVGVAPYAEWSVTVTAQQFVQILRAGGLDVGGSLESIVVDDPPEGSGRTEITAITSAWYRFHLGSGDEGCLQSTRRRPVSGFVAGRPRQRRQAPLNPCRRTPLRSSTSRFRHSSPTGSCRRTTASIVTSSGSTAKAGAMASA